MNIINVLEQEQLRTDIPTFRAGDTVTYPSIRRFGN